jgi:hypothetical protein
VLLLLRRDTDAGVGDREADRDLVPVLVLPAHVHHHFAHGGELDRVADQVHQDLPETTLVADQRVGDRGIDVTGELEPLVVRPERQRAQRALEALAEPERRRVQQHHTRLDLGEVEDVVDDRQQRVGRRRGDRQELPLLRRELGVQRELEHAEHTVHRRPDLVAHVGQELALGSIGRLGLILGAEQILLRLGELSRPRDDAVLEVPIHPGQLLLAGGEVVHHDVERAGELADFAGALDDRALGQVAAGDALGRLGDRGERPGRHGAEADHDERAAEEHGEAHKRGRLARRRHGRLDLLQREAEVERPQRRAFLAADGRRHAVVAA